MTMKILVREMPSTLNRAVTALANINSGGLIVKHRPGIGVNYTLGQIAQEYFGHPPVDIQLDGDYTPIELLTVLKENYFHRMIVINVQKESFACSPIVTILKTACSRGDISYRDMTGQHRFKFESLIVFVNNNPEMKAIPEVLEDRCLLLQVL